MILAIDPGSTESAFVVWDSSNKANHINEFAKVKNESLIKDLREPLFGINEKGYRPIDSIVIEMVASYGMPIGKEVFDTVFWIGRFFEAFKGSARLIYRKDIKLYLCNSLRAKDSNIRQALIDKFEPDLKPKERPKGILKGVTKDIWSAVAVAVYASENP